MAGNQIVYNSGGVTLPDQMLDEIVMFNGLVRKIFGETHDDIVYDREAEFCRRTMKEVFLFADTDKIFPKILAEKRFMKMLETIFRFMRPEPEKTML